MNPIKAPRSNEKLIIYGDSEIQKKPSPNYQTHNSKILSEVYKAAEVLTKPMERSALLDINWKEKGDGKGSRRGGGGVSKKFSTIKAMSWHGLTFDRFHWLF